ncbi:protein of unknown function [Streptomyces sp. KY75]|nr:protein of unknown function [Streptomyces sp. KY70]CAD5979561.1 protein of unknown function [Streptomyces sp. KY75]
MFCHRQSEGRSGAVTAACSAGPYPGGVIRGTHVPLADAPAMPPTRLSGRWCEADEDGDLLSVRKSGDRDMPREAADQRPAEPADLAFQPVSGIGGHRRARTGVRDIQDQSVVGDPQVEGGESVAVPDRVGDELRGHQQRVRQHPRTGFLLRIRSAESHLFTYEGTRVGRRRGQADARPRQRGRLGLMRVTPRTGIGSGTVIAHRTSPALTS